MACGAQKTAWSLLSFKDTHLTIFNKTQKTISTISFTLGLIISWLLSKQDSLLCPSRMVITNFSCTWIPSCSCTPTARHRWSSFLHLSWALTHSMLGQTKYLLNKSSKLLPKMGGVGNKEAITENSNRSCGNWETRIALPLSFCKQRRTPFLCTKAERQSISGIFWFQRSNLKLCFCSVLSSFTSGGKKKNRCNTQCIIK